MAITLVKSPESAQANLLGHPIEFKLRTDNHLEEQGAYAVNYYDIRVGHLYPQTGKILSIKFLQYDIDFPCYANPQPGTFQLTKMASNTLTAALAWKNHALPILNSHPIISKYWTVTAGAYETDGYPWVRYTFTAKEKNSGLFLKQPIVNTGNMVPYIAIITPGKTPSFKSNFYINVQVVNHNYDIIAEIPYKPDQSGYVNFDLAEMLSEQIIREIKITQSPYGIDSTATRFFSIKYSERWAFSEASPIVTSPAYKIMHGNLGHIHQGIFNDQHWTWHQDLEQSQFYLSSRAVVSSAKLNQFLLFGFFTKNTLSNIRLIATIKTSQHQYIDMSLGTWFAFSQHYINVSSLLNNYIDNDEEVKYIYFKIEGTNIPQYRINFIGDFSEGTEFIYRNPWGWYDSIVARGFSKESNKYDKLKEIQHYQATDYHSRERNISHDKPVSRKAFTGNTGLIETTEILMFEELFSSNDCYVVNNGIKIPISIDHSTIKTIDEAKDMQNIQFKYTYAFKDHSPSNLTQLTHP